MAKKAIEQALNEEEVVPKKPLKTQVSCSVH